MILWRNYHFLSFQYQPQISTFLLYVRCKSVVNFVWRRFRDVAQSHFFFLTFPAITPVFRQFKKDTTLQDSLASGSGRGPEAYGVSLLSCAISCAGVDGCESVFYGTVQGSCHHRHLIYNGSVDQDFSTAQGFEYYWGKL